MSKYVLGVDGGGSKTDCALFDTESNKVDMVSCGTTNHECLKGGFEELEARLGDLLSHISARNGIIPEDIGRCVLGLSGVDTRSQHTRISEIIRRLGISDFILCNDAFLGVKAGCENGYGICAINGTGCTVAGIEPSGRMLQIGGQGDLTGDVGGGCYLGTVVVRSVYDSLFKGGAGTNMTDILFEILGISSGHDLMDAIAEGIEGGRIRIEDLNRVVFKAANMGDTVAKSILEKMGAENARSINAVIRELSFPDRIDVVLAGSIYIKGENRTAVDRLMSDVTEANPHRDIVFQMLEHPPVAGAIIWALGEGSSNKRVYARVTEAFSRQSGTFQC